MPEPSSVPQITFCTLLTWACVPTTLSQLIVEAGHPTICNVIVGDTAVAVAVAVETAVAVASGVLSVVSVGDDPLPGEELEQAFKSTIRLHSSNPRPGCSK